MWQEKSVWMEGKRVELALKQKHQADELVDVLTKRCDELRNLLSSERKEREIQLQRELAALDEAFELETKRRELEWLDARKQLEQRCLKERAEKSRVANQLHAALDKIQDLEKVIHELRKQNEQYKGVAQAAVTEANEVVRLLSHLNVKRGVNNNNNSALQQ